MPEDARCLLGRASSFQCHGFPTFLHIFAHISTDELHRASQVCNRNYRLRRNAREGLGSQERVTLHMQRNASISRLWSHEHGSNHCDNVPWKCGSDVYFRIASSNSPLQRFSLMPSKVESLPIIGAVECHASDGSWDLRMRSMPTARVRDVSFGKL